MFPSRQALGGHKRLHYEGGDGVGAKEDQQGQCSHSSDDRAARLRPQPAGRGHIARGQAGMADVVGGLMIHRCSNDGMDGGRRCMVV
jgi:hypothetical protein